jgi:hypothetical protein
MLAKCYECKKEISSDARLCPHCGYYYRDEDALYDYSIGFTVDGLGFRRLSREEGRERGREALKEIDRKATEMKNRIDADDASYVVKVWLFFVLAILFLAWLILR